MPITGDFADYLRDVLGLTPAWHASFRRTRHDVSVESIETGNAYVISYDRSTIVDDTGAAIAGLAELSQCEIEYLYSQSLDPVSYRSVRQDLATLRGLLSDYFDQRGIGQLPTARIQTDLPAEPACCRLRTVAAGHRAVPDLSGRRDR